MPRLIDKLIVNSPFEEPTKYWSYDSFTREFQLIEGRRPAGYIISSQSMSFDDPGVTIEIPIVNKIRQRVRKWREDKYPGITSISRRLLEYWNDPEERENRRLFFAQIEAIETLIWLNEAPEKDKVGIDIPSDGGDFLRICSKMATGTGKTVVMAMLIAYNTLNKVTNPQDNRFSKSFVIVAPGLTIKERLKVLVPDSEGNYFDEFRIVPLEFVEKLRQAKIKILNWHMLASDDGTSGPKVIKKGPESDEAFAKRVLGDLESSKNIVVINDEAHHAWRIISEDVDLSKEEKEEATIWINGLDRINRARGILRGHDFTATPFVPGGKKNTQDMLFSWIVSDFGLNDSIESGLVKTPRVVIRDDATIDSKTLKSKFYHIYEHVKEDLSKKTNISEPLPNLVTTAYYFLGLDWEATYKEWLDSGHKVPPVMITVCNNTATSERVEYSFLHGMIKIFPLCEEGKILRIDSKLLGDMEKLEDLIIESNEEDYIPKSTNEKAQYLRRVVNTVGKEGQPGEQIRSVISVSMLSEGWDAKTVTHILGLRAFTSQLLCEQVVGRGLRRTSYDINPETNLYDAEYVNIFGIPFSFIPHEGVSGGPQPPKPSTMVHVLKDKPEFELKWPNIIRIDHTYLPKLYLDVKEAKPLFLSSKDTPFSADLAAMIDGNPDLSKLSTITLEKIAYENRLQTIIFETAAIVYDQFKHEWKGNKDYLLMQVIKIVEDFINSDKIVFDTLFGYDELRRRVLLVLNKDKVIRHVFTQIIFNNSTKIEPIFDKNKPINSTENMRPWNTIRKCEITNKSHISHAVFDSAFEALTAFELERNENVDAWVKNDHLDFEIPYIHFGEVKRYRPDFIVRLKNKKMLILEVKGVKKERDLSKKDFLEEWIKTVNEHGGFGDWHHEMIENSGQTKILIDKLSK